MNLNQVLELLEIFVDRSILLKNLLTEDRKRILELEAEVAKLTKKK